MKEKVFFYICSFEMPAGISKLFFTNGAETGKCIYKRLHECSLREPVQADAVYRNGPFL